MVPYQVAYAYVFPAVVYLLLGIVYSVSCGRESDKNWIELLSNFFLKRQDNSTLRFWLFFAVLWVFWPIAPYALLVLWGVCRRLRLEKF
jgi:hypothetical protein